MGITFVDFLASNKATKVSPLQYMHGYNIAECRGTLLITMHIKDALRECLFNCPLLLQYAKIDSEHITLMDLRF